MSDADKVSNPEPTDEPDATTATDGFAVTDTPPDPLNGLAECAKNDPGAPFKPEALAELVHLRDTDRAAFETLRGQLKQVGVRVTALDKAMDAAAGGEDNGSAPKRGRALTLPASEPWPEPVDGAELLEALSAAVRRHLVLPLATAYVVALWVLHTWVFERFEHTPRLTIRSPVKQCGKSTLLDVLRAVTHRPLKADNISASGMFRTVEALSPCTLLIDEADTFLRDNDELRGVMNSGFERSGMVIRVVETNGEHQSVQFRTFAPMAVAAIGKLPDTVEDRSTPVVLQRKARTETVTKLRARGARAALAELARKAARWAADRGPRLSADPEIPDAMGDREGDISVPLLAIADEAGGVWPLRARKALLDLFGKRTADEGTAETGTLLLSDIKTIFDAPAIEGSPPADRITSVELCNRLGELDERPWPELRNGKPITPTQLARALRSFGIRPTTIREGDHTPKGYLRKDFEEAWARYSPTSEVAPGAGSEPQHRNKQAKSNVYAGNEAATPDIQLRPQNSRNCSQKQQCCDVAAEKPDLSHRKDWEATL